MPAVEEYRWTLPLLPSFTAGYVGTAGFLALQGLFTAHVTGNFVTLGASLALGTSGAVAKLLALPVFCAVVIAVRILSGQVRAYLAACGAQEVSRAPRPSGQNRVVLLVRLSPQEWFNSLHRLCGSREEGVLPLHLARCGNGPCSEGGVMMVAVPR